MELLVLEFNISQLIVMWVFENIESISILNTTISSIKYCNFGRDCLVELKIKPKQER